MNTIIIILLGFSTSIYADTITKRYPHRSATKSLACRDAKQLAQRHARDECPKGFSVPITSSCTKCNVRKGFGIEQWACTGVAHYKCSSPSRSETTRDNESSYADKTIRSMRKSLIKGTQGGQSPCLQYPNSQKCNEWKRQFKSASGVRN